MAGGRWIGEHPCVKLTGRLTHSNLPKLVSNVYNIGSGHFVTKYQPNLCSFRFWR